MVDSFILDDRSEGVTGTGWFTGSYKYCEDANGGGLSWHHDDGQNKGRVSAIYSLSGRNTSGCFAVSEWHPGGESCSRGGLLDEVSSMRRHVRVLAAAEPEDGRGDAHEDARKAKGRVRADVFKEQRRGQRRCECAQVDPQVEAAHDRHTHAW